MLLWSVYWASDLLSNVSCRLITVCSMMDKTGARECSIAKKWRKYDNTSSIISFYRMYNYYLLISPQYPTSKLVNSSSHCVSYPGSVHVLTVVPVFGQATCWNQPCLVGTSQTREPWPCQTDTRPSGRIQGYLRETQATEGAEWSSLCQGRTYRWVEPYSPCYFHDFQ